MVTKREPARKPARRRTAEPKHAFTGTKWAELAEIGLTIPDEELAKHPGDGAANIKHYLYGHAKKS